MKKDAGGIRRTSPTTGECECVCRVCEKPETTIRMTKDLINVPRECLARRKFDLDMNIARLQTGPRTTRDETWLSRVEI